MNIAVDEYMRLDSEAELYIENTRMPLSWPQEGKVSFKKVFAKYRDGLEYVIRGCSFDIHGGEKVKTNVISITLIVKYRLASVVGRVHFYNI